VAFTRPYFTFNYGGLILDMPSVTPVTAPLPTPSPNPIAGPGPGYPNPTPTPGYGVAPGGPQPAPPAYYPGGCSGNDLTGYVGGTIGGTYGGYVGGFIGGEIFGPSCSGPTYTFWDGSSYQTVPITSDDPQGTTTTSSYDPSSNTVTVTIIPN
jgi:hypothetical protein